MSSTWGEHSLLGSNGDLPARLVAELPVDAEELDRALLENAAIVLRREAGEPGWGESILRRYPGCFMAAEIISDRSIRLTLKAGRRLRISTTPSPRGDPDPRCLPSAVYAWLTSGRTVEDLGKGITVRVGGRTCVITVAPRPF
ncbi:hypothetical protein [Nonomuraea sp. SYSU D8015]|uniref:hypothetical protein n=1 Tax=Nonomuraea sp. SYSU D8015 TaxID=2593644 RepID=UPI0016610A54|nr:hypothetical protein [Nonomuraea sp. SYSU D8015]